MVMPVECWTSSSGRRSGNVGCAVALQERVIWRVRPAARRWPWRCGGWVTYVRVSSVVKIRWLHSALTSISRSPVPRYSTLALYTTLALTLSSPLLYNQYWTRLCSSLHYLYTTHLRAALQLTIPWVSKLYSTVQHAAPTRPNIVSKS